MEVWKRIESYEDYEISNLGNVKSLKYGKERILKKTPDKDGYLLVGLYKNKIGKTLKVHQLIAETFLNHIPCGMELVVDHKNDIKTDNRLDNLQIITNQENIVKSIKKANTSSKYTGIYFHKKSNKWMARIMINYKNIYIGIFNTEIDAYKAYCNQLILNNK